MTAAVVGPDARHHRPDRARLSSDALMTPMRKNMRTQAMVTRNETAAHCKKACVIAKFAIKIPASEIVLQISRLGGWI
jgi:hypothetical protein